MRISALVLWITVPIVVLATIINLSSAEKMLRNEFNDKAELLAFRVGNALLSTPTLEQQRFRDGLLTIAQQLDFRAVRVSINDDDFVVGALSPELEGLTRGLPAVLPNNPGVASTVKITGYHIPFRLMVQKQRENTLVAILVMLTVFGLFLVWAIRTIVHRPLRALVEATQQVSEGHTDLRLEVSSMDEFGTLGRFFNKMLDVLMVQQKKVEHALADAENATRAKSVFLANMSHELRTPLNAIIGYSDMLAEEAEDLGQTATVPDLYKIKTAGKHLLDLINNILDISKIEAGKMELYVEVIDIRAMIQDILITVQPLVDRNNNLLRIEIGEHVGMMQSDVTKLRQALLNLLSNAAKFTNRGVLTLQVDHDPAIDAEHVRFVVSDTGIGM
ncbi:MAG: HAMP domain-containing protein, partial [Gammaproteobacteria bacterium]|nr:HAMP domain-containing protein [Gammaproteobacteria bacterium]